MVQLQWELVLFLGQQGFPCTGAVEPHQPFLLDVWRACALMSGDIARFVARWGAHWNFGTHSALMGFGALAPLFVLKMPKGIWWFTLFLGPLPWVTLR